MIYCEKTPLTSKNTAKLSELDESNEEGPYYEFILEEIMVIISNDRSLTQY